MYLYFMFRINIIQLSSFQTVRLHFTRTYDAVFFGLFFGPCIFIIEGRTDQRNAQINFSLINLLMQNTSMVSFDGGSACKVDDVTALPSHIQDGGYALLWQRYDNNKMAAICYSTSSTVQSQTELVFYCSNCSDMFRLPNRTHPQGV